MPDTAEFRRLDKSLVELANDMQEVKIGIARIEQRMSDKTQDCQRHQRAIEDLYEKRGEDHKSIIKVFVTAIIGVITAGASVLVAALFKGN